MFGASCYWKGFTEAPSSQSGQPSPLTAVYSVDILLCWLSHWPSPRFTIQGHPWICDAIPGALLQGGHWNILHMCCSLPQPSWPRGMASGQSWSWRRRLPSDGRGRSHWELWAGSALEGVLLGPGQLFGGRSFTGISGLELAQDAPEQARSDRSGLDRFPVLCRGFDGARKW